MPFLTVAGFTIPVAAETTRRPPPESIGATERAADGSLFSNRRTRKRRIQFDLVPLEEEELLEAYEGLLSGEGQVWAFEAEFGLYSYKGLGPASAAGTSTAAGGKFSRKLSLDVTPGTITYATGLPSRWTVMVWFWNGSEWDHYTVRSDGAKWVDGVRNDVAGTPWLSVSVDGDVTLTNPYGVTQDFSDLVVLPYLVPSSWPAVVFASTRAFSQLPRLEVTGTALLGSSSADPVLMEGEVGDAEYVGRSVQKLSATLREV